MNESEKCDLMKVKSEELLNILDGTDDNNDEEIYELYKDEDDEIETDSDFNKQLEGKFSLSFSPRFNGITEIRQ